MSQKTISEVKNEMINTIGILLCGGALGFLLTYCLIPDFGFAFLATAIEATIMIFLYLLFVLVSKVIGQ